MTWTLSAFADEAGTPLEEQIRALQEAGYRYIDLRGVNSYNITELPEDDAKNVKKQLDDAGIAIAMFGSPIGKIDLADDFDIDLNKLKHLGKLAPILGCNRVRIFSYFNKAGLPESQWRAQSLDRLKQLAEVADNQGLELFHENEKHIFGDTCERVETIADELRGARFRLIFDFSNYNQLDENVWENWTRLRDRTDAFHLKDSSAEHMHVPIGQGAGYAKDILADALKRGWDGPLTLEPHLAHSEAVLATGPSGAANESLKDLSPFEAFQVGAGAARNVLNEIGAAYE